MPIKAPTVAPDEEMLLGLGTAMSVHFPDVNLSIIGSSDLDASRRTHGDTFVIRLARDGGKAATDARRSIVDAGLDTPGWTVPSLDERHHVVRRLLEAGPPIHGLGRQFMDQASSPAAFSVRPTAASGGMLTSSLRGEREKDCARCAEKSLTDPVPATRSRSVYLAMAGHSPSGELGVNWRRVNIPQVVVDGIAIGAGPAHARARSLTEQADHLKSACELVNRVGPTGIMGAAALSCTQSFKEAETLLISGWDFPASRASIAVRVGAELGRFGGGGPLSAISGARLSQSDLVSLARLFDHDTLSEGAPAAHVSLAAVQRAAARGKLRTVADAAIRSRDRPSVLVAAALLAGAGCDDPSEFVARLQT
jgi:hypothetical protein